MPGWSRDILGLTKECDLDGLKKFIAENPKYDINTKDHRGVSALHLAVKLNCRMIVKFLLEQPNIKIRDTALLAVAENNIEFAVLLLDTINKQNNKQAEFKGVEGSSAYPPYMTPLMLAALYGHYNMIKMLIKRNHRLEKPHDMYCACTEKCNDRLATDKLVSVDKRIALFRAISNPAYICITSKDPILTALRLYKDLKNWSNFDTTSSEEYGSIARNVAKFSSDLMDQTNNTREVEIILKRKEGWVYSGKTTYPRLMMAMIYENKEFVGNIHVQQVLENNWYGNFQWKKCSLISKMTKVLIRIFCIPVVAILTAIIPHNSWVASQKHTPAVLFIDRSIMFIVFLIVLTWENNIDRKTMNRGFPTTYAEPFVILFTFAYLWRLIRLAMLQGIARYFRFNWHIWEIVMITFLMITITCWGIAFIKYNIGTGDISVPRNDWPSLEPILIAESALVFATFMAYLKILFLIQLHPIFGPLQMSLASMLRDCVTFLLIFGIFLLAFGIGVNNLYSYYEGHTYKEPGSEEVSKQNDAFTSFWSSIVTLYWSLFGLSELSSGAVIINNGNKHHITQATGYFMFTVFSFTMIIVVINMLIASLTNTFQGVQDNNLNEWSYGKTEVFLAHMDGLLVIPVPFNILFEWVNDLKNLVRDIRDKNKRWHCSFLHGCFMASINNEENDAEYLLLMTNIRSRYFLKNCKLFNLGVPEISDDFCANDDDD